MQTFSSSPDSIFMLGGINAEVLPVTTQHVSNEHFKFHKVV